MQGVIGKILSWYLAEANYYWTPKFYIEFAFCLEKMRGICIVLTRKMPLSHLRFE